MSLSRPDLGMFFFLKLRKSIEEKFRALENLMCKKIGLVGTCSIFY